jgi:hypothetical protein
VRVVEFVVLLSWKLRMIMGRMMRTMTMREGDGDVMSRLYAFSNKDRGRVRGLLVLGLFKHFIDWNNQS